jgi:two-component system, LytTR family, sensor kinase
MLVSAVWLAPALLATINDVVQPRLHGNPAPSLDELLWSGGDWLVYALLTPPIFYVCRRWPIARPHISRRAVLHLTCALLFCVAWACSGKLLQLGLRWAFRADELRQVLAEAGDAMWPMIGRDLLSWIFTTLPFGVVVYLSIAGMAHAIGYFVEAGDREVQVARLAEQLSSARLTALQSQLNPHFLFNSLNTIAVLTRDGNTTAATRVVEQLSEVLRSTLDRTQANEVALEDELDLVREYLAVEQARFSDRLRPEFRVEPAVLSAAVPSFALQHLVENAIRHGIARRTDAGRIVISARRSGESLELTVADDGAGIAAGAADVRGHGLDNTRERLKTLYPAGTASLDVVAEATGTLARLIVPYHELLLEPEHHGRP